MIQKNPIRVTLALQKIGDTLLSLPAARYIMRNPIYNLDRVELYTNHNEIVSLLDIMDECSLMNIRNKTQYPEIFLVPEVERHLEYFEPMHRVEEAYWWLGYEPSDIPMLEKNYPKFRKDKMLPRKFSEPYVVLSGTFACRRRKFSDRVMYRTCKYLKQRGYLPVIVGQTRSTGGIRYGVYNVNYEGCVNLVDKLRLRELLSIMSEAEAVVGPDSGLLHLAGLTDVPIIGYYTIISGEYVVPIRNDMVGSDCVIIEAPISCASCYSKTDNLWRCMEQYKADPVMGYKKEGDAECVKVLRVSYLREALQEIGIK